MYTLLVDIINSKSKHIMYVVLQCTITIIFKFKHYNNVHDCIISTNLHPTLCTIKINQFSENIQNLMQTRHVSECNQSVRILLKLNINIQIYKNNSGWYKIYSDLRYAKYNSCKVIHILQIWKIFQILLVIFSKNYYKLNKKMFRTCARELKTS